MGLNQDKKMPVDKKSPARRPLPNKRPTIRPAEPAPEDPGIFQDQDQDRVQEPRATVDIVRPEGSSPAAESRASRRGKGRTNTAPSAYEILNPLKRRDREQKFQSVTKGTDDWAAAPETIHGLVQQPTFRNRERTKPQRERLRQPMKIPAILVGEEKQADTDPFASYPDEYRTAVELVVKVAEYLWPDNEGTARTFSMYMIAVLKDLFAEDFNPFMSRIIGRLLAKSCQDPNLAFPRWSDITDEARDLLVRSLRVQIASPEVAGAVLGIAEHNKSVSGSPLPNQLASVWCWLTVFLSTTQAFCTLGPEIRMPE